MAFLSVNLAKVVISQEGTIVEDEGTRDDHFEVSPHFAQVASVVFHMKRHIAIVERRSRVTTSGAWRTAIHNILAESARSLGYRSTIEFEPIPPEEEILSAFRSFSRLTRIRLRLRLPNPEVTAASKALFEEMTTARVREYLHDMKNEQGLSQEEGGLPHAAATIAEAGYKKNKVTLEGISDGKKQKVNVGGKAVSGEWDGIKSFIRGMHSNAKTKEMRTSLPKLLDEVDRLAPPPEDE
ncbi:MAG: hypothetical protein KDA52_15390 [Planctomycetaceae bacterium]|nr:hypothetical protein [Planctomycetaceae bacterium]